MLLNMTQNLLNLKIEKENRSGVATLGRVKNIRSGDHKSQILS